ncbi:DUF2938 domain-containing protein [Curvivirga sp.]|uniref:DUF2938 domain-containing protein n=1 Tax=Curvivirga sp. TaxID=2856848 RepID=UPI003B59A01E
MDILSFFIHAALIGIIATIIMDIWALFLKAAFNIVGLNYGMVGRWIGHIFNGKLTHQGIGKSSKIAGESIIGWVSHYVIGILFAAMLVLIWGSSPTFIQSLIIGISTIVFPFFLMQPCFGMGIAGSNLPKPNNARLKSLITHFIFGLGLYLGGFTTKIILSQFL